MPVLKVKNNGIWEDVIGSGNADTLDGKHASDFALAAEVADIDHGHDVATTSSDGFMSAADKVKLNSLKVSDITVDSELSSTSTNPVQNKVVNAAISNLQTLIGDESVSTQIETAVANISSGKTLAEHLAEEEMVCSSLQYGDALPDPGTAGRIFFKKVSS